MARANLFALCLLMLGRLRGAVAEEPAATGEQVELTVERAVGYLQTESTAWLKTRKCAACHHAPLPLWTLSEAGVC